MGCDVHTYAEKKSKDGKWESIPTVELFRDRNYFVFELLAGVRSHTGIKPIAKPRGIPKDATELTREEYNDWGQDAHTPSWLSLEELLEFDYKKVVDNKRFGETNSYRYFMGESFFDDLSTMKKEGIERVVFWFDN